MKSNNKLIILDGNSLAHRAFYALPLLTNRKGVFTNAAYGFTTMLLKILKAERPEYVVVAFDKGKTFRHEQFEAYKGHRKATPQELKPQFPLIWQILDALRIAAVQLEGYEADDLIGTIARKAEQAGLMTMIVTGDRDALQLVTARTKALITRKGISNLDVFDRTIIQEKYGLEPLQLRDVKGLMGDASDNIPGIPGIGEKTAVKLVQEFGSIENLLKNLDGLSNRKMAEKIQPYREQALLSKELGTINCAVPLEIEFDLFRWQGPDYSALLEIFKELEFNSLLKDVLAEMKVGAAEPEAKAAELKVTYLSECREMLRLLENIKDEKISCYLALDQRDHLKAEILAIGVAWAGGNVGLNCGSLHASEIREILTALFGKHQQQLVTHDLKSCLVLAKKRGVEIKARGRDTMLAAYLLNPSAPNYELPTLSLEYLNKPLVPVEQPEEEVARAAQVIFKLDTILDKKLNETGMDKLYTDVELPLEEVLALMELQGVKLDKEQLLSMGQELAQGIESLTAEIYELAGEEFNINSPKQLGVILFEKLGLPPLKKTKTGYSTNAEVLEELAERHEVVAKILEYRQLVKLKSTYIDGLLALINPETGKVHTTFNQTITATGRLSSTEPNLQNIPIRLEAGRRLRKAFIPSTPDHLLLAADYSQIELRVLAHIAGDPGLKDAFIKDQDIHTRTASEVFGVPMDEVTKDMRRRAKAVNFGIVYGISDFGLSRDLGISRKEAQEYIALYFSRYPGVKKYIEEVIFHAREQGYVTTVLNRRRYLPDIFSSNRNIRGFGERAAMNTPIQGSAADIIKLAMLKVHQQLAEAGLKTVMLLQVHDELIFEVPKNELEKAQAIIQQAMENAYELQVPLKVDMKVGANWYDMEVLA